MAYNANKQPDELTALTSLDSGDVFVVGDVSDAVETAKMITKANLITDLTTSFAPALGADDNYVTDAEKTKLANLSGTNTGDQTLPTESTTVTFSSDGTWTKDAGLKRIFVRAWGAGGSGASCNTSTDEAGGGGGGGYIEAWFEAGVLGATETVTVGTGGAAVTGDAHGNAGENTTFGSLLTAYGGGGGAWGTTGAGGGGGGGPLGAGGSSTTSAAGAAGAPGAPFGAEGGNGGGAGTVSAALYGGGGGGSPNGGNGQNGGSCVYGGGGGGGSTQGTAGSGGSSVFGGAGGAGLSANTANTGDATSGSVPGGGGGAKESNAGSGNSGAGGDGKVIVVEYYY